MTSKKFCVLIIFAFATAVTSRKYCFPGDDSCWPSTQDGLDFAASLEKPPLVPTNPLYANYTVMINTRVTKYPYAIVMAETISDVIKSVKFANKFGLKVSIRSSGHDYLGRSTGDGTLQINLFYMQGLKFNLNSTRHAAGELTAQSGNSWIRVYNETNKVGRVIVGGSAHTVSMGGYTLGGGHSPVCRKFGMAVDNLLEVEMVTANGSLVYADENSTRFVDPETGGVLSTSSNTDIFWAVRGGGGGTFGVVTAFTYKLHYDSKMVVLSCYSPVIDDKGNDAGRVFLKKFNDLLTTTLAQEWGGYQILGQSTENGNNGSILLFLNHFGEWGSDSYRTIEPFTQFAGPYCYSVKNVSSFYEYEKDTYDPLYYDNYIFNTLMQHDSFTDEFYDFAENLVTGYHGMELGAGCTGTLLGGKMQDVGPDETAVTPNFRTALMSMSCGVTPGKGMDFSTEWVGVGEQLSVQLLKFGNGTYYNEPSAYLPNWKSDNWGGHYQRLLEIKKAWDPDHVLTCLHCVGSDWKADITGMHPLTGNPVDGEPSIVG